MQSSGGSQPKQVASGVSPAGVLQPQQPPQGSGQSGTPGLPKPGLPLQGPGHTGTQQQQDRTGVTGGAGPPQQASQKGGQAGAPAFSAQQLSVLRNQIYAFRRIKVRHELCSVLKLVMF